MLRTLGIPHQVTTISGDAERRALEQRTGRGSLPQVFIAGQFIGGYDDLADLQGLGGLERLRQP
jgi:glutaredoxin